MLPEVRRGEEGMMTFAIKFVIVATLLVSVLSFSVDVAFSVGLANRIAACVAFGVVAGLLCLLHGKFLPYITAMAAPPVREPEPTSGIVSGKESTDEESTNEESTNEEATDEEATDEEAEDGTAKDGGADGDSAADVDRDSAETD